MNSFRIYFRYISLAINVLYMFSRSIHMLSTSTRITVTYFPNDSMVTTKAALSQQRSEYYHNLFNAKLLQSTHFCVYANILTPSKGNLEDPNFIRNRVVAKRFSNWGKLLYFDAWRMRARLDKDILNRQVYKSRLSYVYVAMYILSALNLVALSDKLALYVAAVSYALRVVVS